jgi:hypothetical protein
MYRRVVPVFGLLSVAWFMTGLASVVLGSAVEDDNYSRSSLRGIPGVYVAVQPLTPEIEKNGLTAAQLKVDTELRLRTAGIGILSRQEWSKTKGGPVCYVEVDIVNDILLSQALKADLYAYAITVELNQDVILLRDTSIQTLSPTWSGSYLGITNSLPRIRDKVRDMVEKFVEACLAVNPEGVVNSEGRREGESPLTESDSVMEATE